MAIDPDEFQQKLAALRASYGQKMPGQIREVETLVAKVFEGGTTDQVKEALKDVHAQAHKLGGSSGTFGFAAVSDAAHGIENFTDNLLEAGEAMSADKRRELEQLLSVLSKAAD